MTEYARPIVAGEAGSDTCPPPPIEVSGCYSFVRRMRRALRLLSCKAPREFDVVARYVRWIEEGERSEALVGSQPATVVLEKDLLHESLNWCAGVIVHEAYHFAHYYECQCDGSLWRPSDASAIEVEKLCIDSQLALLEDLRARHDEIAWLRRQDGSHCLTQPRRARWPWFLRGPFRAIIEFILYPLRG